MDQTIVIYPIKFVWINHFESKEYYFPSVFYFYFLIIIIILF